jgi:hypothetical protein
MIPMADSLVLGFAHKGVDVEGRYAGRWRIRVGTGRHQRSAHIVVSWTPDTFIGRAFARGYYRVRADRVPGTKAIRLKDPNWCFTVGRLMNLLDRHRAVPLDDQDWLDASSWETERWDD